MFGFPMVSNFWASTVGVKGSPFYEALGNEAGRRCGGWGFRSEIVRFRVYSCLKCNASMMIRVWCSGCRVQGLGCFCLYSVGAMAMTA